MGESPLIVPHDVIDEIVESTLRRQQIPGLSLAVVRNGSVLKSKGYGLANLEHHVPVRPDTVFQIGSVTKQFTAAAVLLLADEGKVDLDAPALEYLSTLPSEWGAVTVRQLLTHTSGLDSVTEVPGFSYRRDYTRDELLELAASYPFKFPPGGGWFYSNTGYSLLGWIVEDVSGREFGEFLAGRIFGPLNMESTRMIRYEEVVPHRAAGYNWTGSRHERGEPLRPQAVAGSGGLLSTVLDLAKWDAALATDFPLHCGLKARIWTPARLNDGSPAVTDVECGPHYGFGWFLGEDRGRRLVSHTGVTDAGFSSEILRLPDDGLTVIFLSNVEPVEQDQFSRRIARECLGE
jgi:D-alanyl-D-alanine carboxypeptidase